MIKILIIDDEEAACNILKILIGKYVPKPVEIITCTSPTEGLNLLKTFQPQLVMLDIEMPEMNGFDFLNRAVNWNFDIIFTTAYDKYAIKAIRFSALDYLLKPIDLVDLQNALNRHLIRVQGQTPGPENNELKYTNLIRNLNQKDHSDFRLALSVKQGITLYELKNIILLEGQNNYTKFYFDHEKPLLVSKTLKDFEDILEDHNFFRAHKSYLVNTAHITRMDKENLLWLTTNLHVPVSRRKKQDILQILQANNK